MFSRRSFQEHSQSTISRPAHYVLSLWASGEKTELFGVLLLAQASRNCVQHIVSTHWCRLCVPSARSTAETKKTWLQYKKTAIQASGTTFSNFSDEIRPEEGHGKCCRFGTLTGVHQDAHICPDHSWLDWNARRYSRKTKCPQEK